MNKYDYTYAVARIRANEARLLTQQQLSAVIAAPSFEDALRRVSDFGYDIGDGGYTEALDKRRRDADELVFGIVPDRKMLDSLIIKNDFANLKLCLKALVCNKSTDGLMTTPSVYDPEEIKKLVFERKNDKLPECMRHADRSGYRILTQTRFAQLADSVIDRAAMEQTLAFAEKADNDVMREIAEAFVALTDIKVLYRTVRAKKEESFMLRAVAECATLDRRELVRAAARGEESFFEFLSHTPYSKEAGALKTSQTEFEKKSDEYILGVLGRVKNDPFGIAPIVAYRFAVNTEIINLRIILSAKHNGMSEASIRERVRGADV